MAVIFPNIRPTKRSFDTGDFPTKTFDAVNGSSTTRLYGNKAFNASLKLEFMASDSETANLLNCWSSAQGKYDSIIISNTHKIYEGMDASVFPDSLNWRWAEKPKVTSVVPNLSRVTVNLIATLEA